MMKRSAAALAVLFSTLGIAQDQARGTYLGAHLVGETVQAWLTINQLDLGIICKSRKREDKTICKNLSSYRDGKTGTFFTTNDTKRKYEWLFIDGRVAEVSTGDALEFSVNGSHFAVSTMQEQIGFLTQLYGPPTKTKAIPYQNALGAKWDCLEATWQMPDGGVIWAVESIENTRLGSGRNINVRFLSSDRVRQLGNAQQAKPNPYAH